MLQRVSGTLTSAGTTLKNAAVNTHQRSTAIAANFGAMVVNRYRQLVNFITNNRWTSLIVGGALALAGIVFGGYFVENKGGYALVLFLVAIVVGLVAFVWFYAWPHRAEIQDTFNKWWIEGGERQKVSVNKKTGEETPLFDKNTGLPIMEPYPGRWFSVRKRLPELVLKFIGMELLALVLIFSLDELGSWGGPALIGIVVFLWTMLTKRASLLKPMPAIVAGGITFFLTWYFPSLFLGSVKWAAWVFFALGGITYLAEETIEGKNLFPWVMLHLCIGMIMFNLCHGVINFSAGEEIYVTQWQRSMPQTQVELRSERSKAWQRLKELYKEKTKGEEYVGTYGKEEYVGTYGQAEREESSGNTDGLLDSVRKIAESSFRLSLNAVGLGPKVTRWSLLKIQLVDMWQWMFSFFAILFATLPGEFIKWWINRKKGDKTGLTRGDVVLVDLFMEATLGAIARLFNIKSIQPEFQKKEATPKETTKK